MGYCTHLAQLPYQRKRGGGSKPRTGIRFLAMPWTFWAMPGARCQVMPSQALWGARPGSDSHGPSPLASLATQKIVPRVQATIGCYERKENQEMWAVGPGPGARIPSTSTGILRAG